MSTEEQPKTAFVKIAIDISKWQELREISHLEIKKFIHDSLDECMRNDFDMKGVNIEIDLESKITPAEPQSVVLSAEEYLNKIPLLGKRWLEFENPQDELQFMVRHLEGFADLRVQQERSVWEKEKIEYAADQVAKAIQVMSHKKY